MTLSDFFRVVLYQPLFNLLIFLVWLVPGHSVGWAIILLTILIRLALVPSGLKTARVQKKMKELQPLIQKLKEQHKGDKKAEAQATMALYKEYKVSPFSSCLPLVWQLPILIVLYRVFRDGLTTERFSLLYTFVPRPEAVNHIFLGMDLSSPERFVLPLLTGLTQYFQGRQIQKMTPQSSPQEKGDFQKILNTQMTFIMPIFTVIIAMQLPAALPLYWIITTLFMVVQTWWVNKKEPPLVEIAPEKMVERKGGVEVEVRTPKE